MMKINLESVLSGEDITRYLIREHGNKHIASRYYPFKIEDNSTPREYSNLGSQPFGYRGNFRKTRKQRTKFQYGRGRLKVAKKTTRFFARELARFAKKTLLVKGMYPKVFYGGASIRTNMKGLDGGAPTKKLRMIFDDHFDCRIVNEDYNSQMCYACDQRLKKCMSDVPVDGHSQEIRAVRKCTNDACQKTINNGHIHDHSLKSRDGNASQCILEKGEYAEENNGEYPEKFNRKNTAMEKFYITPQPKNPPQPRNG